MILKYQILGGRGRGRPQMSMWSAGGALPSRAACPLSPFPSTPPRAHSVRSRDRPADRPARRVRDHVTRRL